MFRIVIVLVFVMSPVLAADQRPGFSLVYDTKENSGLQISCTDVKSNEVQCDLKQISIFKKAKEGAQQKIEEARQQFRSAPKTKMDPKQC